MAVARIHLWRAPVDAFGRLIDVQVVARHIYFLVAVSMPLTALADLYTADDAMAKQDFARSFELYRELAELGRREAQENLAVMYVNGEGVKRDNVVGLCVGGHRPGEWRQRRDAKASSPSSSRT